MHVLPEVINILKVTEHALITHRVMQMTHISHVTLLSSSRGDHALLLVTFIDIMI